MAEMIKRGLSEEQRMMRDAIRAFVDGEVTPFIRKSSAPPITCRITCRADAS